MILVTVDALSDHTQVYLWQPPADIELGTTKQVDELSQQFCDWRDSLDGDDDACTDPYTFLESKGFVDVTHDKASEGIGFMVFGR